MNETTKVFCDVCWGDPCFCESKSEPLPVRSESAGSVSDSDLWNLVELWEKTASEGGMDAQDKGMSMGLEIAATHLRSFLPKQNDTNQFHGRKI